MENKVWVEFNGVLFNTKAMAKRTFDQFVEHEKHHGIPVEKMREFYDLYVPKKEEAKAAVGPGRAKP